MKKLLLILTLILMISTSACAVGGTYTDNGYFYLPAYGAYGADEFAEYNTYMQIADTQIEANKTALSDEGVEDVVGAMTTGGNTETFISVDYQDTTDDMDFVVPVKDEDDMASDSATHLATQQSIKAYVLAEAGGATTFPDLTDTPAGYDNGKYAKSTAAGVVWDVPTGAGDMLKAVYDTDEDSDVDVSSGGTEKSSWTQYCIPYLSGTTAFGEIPIGTAEYALTVAAGATGYDWTLFDLSLYYLKTAIDTQTEVETIWGVSLVNDGDLASYYLKTAIDTLPEVEAIYVKDITDSTELASALTDYYLKTAIDTQGEVETIWGVALTTDTELASALTDYYLKTAIDTQGEVETIWGVTLATDAEITALNFTDLADTPAGYETGKYAKSTAAGIIWDTALGVDTYGTPADNDIAMFTDLNTIEGRSHQEHREDIQNHTWYPQDYATGAGTVGDPWDGRCIQDAIDAASAGDTVYFRAGYYQATGHLTVTKRLNIVGEGIQNTIIKTGEYYGFNVHTAADYSTFRNFTIDASGQSYTAYIYAINLNDMDYCVIENVETFGSGYYAINLYQCNHTYLHNVYSYDNDRHGIHAGSDAAGKNYYNTYRDIYVWNNTVNGFDDRGYASSVPATCCNNVYDRIYSWDNTEQGLDICYSRGFTLTNSIFYSNTTYGGRLRTVEDVMVSNCLFDDNGSKGLYIVYDPVNVNLINVIVKNNTGNGFETYGGDDIRLVNCQAFDDQGSKTQTYGFATAGTCGVVELVNCDLTGNATGNINNAGTATITVNKGVDDLDLVFGEGADWLVQYDEGVDDQLLWITAGTTAGADTDAMYEIITGASMDADQQCFAVSKGTQSSKTQLFAVDEDGEITVGTWVATAIADAYVPNDITINLATLATTITVTDNESTAENNPLCFVAGADPDGGSLGIETDGTCYYTPSTGKITTTGFVGALTGNADTVTSFTPASGSLTLAGADAVTITTTAATGVTLPTTGTLLANTLEDTSPELGGELDAGAHSIGFTQHTATGDGATLINWTVGNQHKFTFGAQNETITFTNPSNPCAVRMIVVQDATGSRTITWSGMTIKWAGGTAPTLTTTASGEDVVSFIWDGTSYYGAATLAFATP